MSARRPPPPGSAQAPPRDINVPLPYRLPVHVDLAIDAQKKWLAMVQKAEWLYKEDRDLQKKVAKGLRIKERRLPPEILGRLYAQYCALINEMYDAYLNNVQLQRAAYIQEIINLLIKRMFELRNELVHIIVNDYLFVDSSLKQVLKTPYDIQIVVPYHFAMDSRPGTYEDLLQRMWRDAVRRKKRAERPKKVVLRKLSDVALDDNMLKGAEETKKGGEEDEKKGEEAGDEAVEEESEIEEEEEEDEERKSEAYMKAILIQKHERFRQFFLLDFVEKCNYRRTYFVSKSIVPPTPEMMQRAANFIQKFYRRFMQAKREHIQNHKRDVILGMVPDIDRRALKFREENEKLYERRRQTRQKLNVHYEKQVERERERLYFWGHNYDQMEDITKEIREWFEEWYYDYRFFPQYPYEIEGGTILVIRGDYPTIEEQREDDEKYKKATKGKNKEQLLQEKKQAKYEAELKKEADKERERKEREAYFKSRCNPDSDLGYVVKTSENIDPIYDAICRYRMAWSIYDNWPLDRCGDVIYGFMKPLITEDLMEKMHLECRKIVDQMMRLELKVFIKAQKMMYMRCDTLFPKQRKRKRPKPPPVVKPFEVDGDMIKSVEPVFDLQIVTKPTDKLDDIIGDLSYGAYECNVEDPKATFPSPGYGDVKRRLVLSCIFGAGLEPNADRKKSVMLMGLERNGKSFLADCVAGEMNAVKFDISPEVFSSKVKAVGKMLKMVLTAARIFQPSVIFFKNIERVFYKTVPAKEKKLKARKMKGPLKNLVKAIPPTEKVIFIATCSQPFLAKVRPMMKMFSEVIIVPKPDYGSLQRFFYEKFQSIRLMPRDYCVQGLAKVMQNIGFGKIMEIYDNIMTPKRICELCYRPLEQSEFIEYMIMNDIEPMDERDYQKIEKLWLQYSPFKVERAEYEIINRKRAEAYKKLEKAKAAREAKKAQAGK